MQKHYSSLISILISMNLLICNLAGCSCSRSDTDSSSPASLVAVGADDSGSLPDPLATEVPEEDTSSGSSSSTGTTSLSVSTPAPSDTYTSNTDTTETTVTSDSSLTDTTDASASISTSKTDDNIQPISSVSTAPENAEADATEPADSSSPTTTSASTSGTTESSSRSSTIPPTEGSSGSASTSVITDQTSAPSSAGSDTTESSSKATEYRNVYVSFCAPGGEVQGTGDYAVGSEATITVVPTDKYHLLCSAKLVLYDEQRDRTFEREISTTSPFTFTVPDNGGHDIALVIFMYDFRYLPLVPMPQVCYATADYEVDPYWTFASDEPDENGVFHPHYGHICMEVTLYTTRGLLDNHNGTIYGYEGDPQLEIVEEYIRQIEESSGERIVVWGYGNSEYNNVRYYRESPDPSSWDLEKIKAGFIS